MNRFFIVSGLLFLLVGGMACQSPEAPVAAVVADQPKKLPEPIRFLKSLEVKPGLTFDVMSWGRGSASSGGYLLLRSDSAALKYRTTSGELNGEIVDAWNMDMDADGDPEIFIQAKGQGEGSFLSLYVYEFTSSGSSQQLRFPDLSAASKKSYRGLDSLYVLDGKLRRDFPLFNENDNSGKPSGGKKTLEYTLRSNTFNVKEVTGTEAK